MTAGGRQTALVRVPVGPGASGRRRAAGLAAGLLLCVLAGQKPRTGEAAPPATGGAAGGVTYVDVAARAGLDFRHTNGSGGPAARRYYIETMCGGVAFVDYDADGFLDVYAVNGWDLSDPSAPRASNRLFRNLGDGSFADVTELTRSGDTGYGMGVTAGDYDNDGYPDLYITNYGPNVLLRNRPGPGGGRVFEDVTAAAGVGDSLWGVGAAFLDYDNDGDLDLYVANYLEYRLEDASRTLRPYVARGVQPGGGMGYPHPDNFRGAADVLYRNDGGHFTDVTRAASVFRPDGKGMGLATADYDDDGDVDVFVANDQTENFLWENRGDGTFIDVGLPSGTAYDRDGRLQSGMGADFGDYNNDGRMDLFLTVYQAESNALYANVGRGFFTEVAYPAGLAIPSLPFVSWGTVFVDFDNDGRRDLFVGNGHVLDNAEAFDSSTRYLMPNQLFRSLGPDAGGQWRFADVSAAAGEAVTALHASRGVAAGDFDNDGDVDLVVLYLNDRLALLRNEGGNRNHWLTVRTEGRRSNRDGIGARVRVSAGDLVQTDQVLTGGSYLSHSDMRLAFGLGERPTVDHVEVRWPSGTVDRVGPLAADQIITIVEGEGVR